MFVCVCVYVCVCVFAYLGHSIKEVTFFYVE